MNNAHIPGSEKWLYEGNNLSKLEKALDWAEKTPPGDNFDTFVKLLGFDDSTQPTCAGKIVPRGT